MIFALLDRDGTLIEECHYLCEPEKVRLLPGVAEGLLMLRSLHMGLIMVTNQSGIGRGYFDDAAVDAVHRRLAELLGREGVALDGIYICPHAPEEECSCRKPLPGLALAAASDHGFNTAEAFVIGDKACDVELAVNIGATPILVRTGYGAQQEKELSIPGLLCADTLKEAARKITALLSEKK